MKKLLAMLVIMAAVFTAFNIAQAGQGRDYDRAGQRDYGQARQVDQCSLEFGQYDVSGTGAITYQQFENAWYGLGTMKGVTPHASSIAFSTDRDNDGYISIAEFCGRWHDNIVGDRMRG